MNVINNELFILLIGSWGAKYLIVPDVPIQCVAAKLPDLKGKSHVTLVNTFATDEPISQFLDATKKLLEIQFFVTGKLENKNRIFTDLQLNNVHFTDWLMGGKIFNRS